MEGFFTSAVQYETTGCAIPREATRSERVRGRERGLRGLPQLMAHQNPSPSTCAEGRWRLFLLFFWRLSHYDHYYSCIFLFKMQPDSTTIRVYMVLMSTNSIPSRGLSALLRVFMFNYHSVPHVSQWVSCLTLLCATLPSLSRIIIPLSLASTLRHITHHHTPPPSDH